MHDEAPTIESLLDRDAYDITAKVVLGEVSAVELTEIALARIASRDQVLNAVKVTDPERSIASARRVRAIAPFAGVPFLMKDLGPGQAGWPLTNGSWLARDHTPQADSTLGARFAQLGFVTVGTSATAEFGVLPTTESPTFGVTRNPYDPTLTAGGSSGGAAAAVAGGLVPIAHANDAGGSIRVPAACCGAFGLKPSRGRVPMGPAVGDLMNGMAAEFVITRSVRDAAAVLHHVGHPDLGDPYAAPPAEDYRTRARLSTARGPMRIAYSTDGLDAAMSARVLDAVAVFDRLGHELVEVNDAPTFEDVAELFLVVWAAGVSSAVSTYASLCGRRVRAGDLEEVTRALFERGRRLSAAEYLMTIGELQRVARRVARVYEHFDARLTAATRMPAPRLGVLRAGSVDDQLAAAVAFVHQAPMSNVTGHPSASIPAGRIGTAPVGIELTGNAGGEGVLLELSAQYEAARPWPLVAPPDLLTRPLTPSAGTEMEKEDSYVPHH